MKIYVDNNNCIKDVNFTSDTTLSEIEVTDGTFDDWSVAKICCYKVKVVDGHVVMLTPYVDSRLIEHIDRLGNEVPKKYSKRAYIGDTECAFPYMDGIVTASVVDELGNSIPCDVTINNLIIVSFGELNTLATVTISII